MSDDYVCEVCAAFARLTREIPKGHSLFDVCKCAGYQRVIWYGTVPTTITEFEKLCRALKKLAGLSKKSGRKRKVTFIEVEQTIERLPGTATLSEVAGALNVSESTVERILKPFKPLYPTFQALQDAIKRKSKPRFKKKFFKGIRRR